MKFKLLLLLIIVFSLGTAFSTPDYVGSVPPGHVLGVSEPSRAIAGARRSAMESIARQLRLKAGWNGEASSDSWLPYPPSAARSLRISHDVIVKIGQRIVDEAWRFNGEDYVYYILARRPTPSVPPMPTAQIATNVSAYLSYFRYGTVMIRVSEVEGSPVRFHSADIHIQRHESYAKKVGLFPSSSSGGSKSWMFTTVLESVSLHNSSRIVRLDLKEMQTGISDFRRGGNFSYTVVLHGENRSSEPVAVRVLF